MYIKNPYKNSNYTNLSYLIQLFLEKCLDFFMITVIPIAHYCYQVKHKLWLYNSCETRQFGEVHFPHQMWKLTPTMQDPSQNVCGFPAGTQTFGRHLSKNIHFVSSLETIIPAIFLKSKMLQHIRGQASHHEFTIGTQRNNTWSAPHKEHLYGVQRQMVSQKFLVLPCLHHLPKFAFW